MSRYADGRRHEELLVNRLSDAEIPNIRSAKSAKIDVIGFGENGEVLLIECKRSKSDVFYLHEKDYATLLFFYEGLKDLKHNPVMMLSLWIPRHKFTKEIRLEPDLLRVGKTLKFVYENGDVTFKMLVPKRDEQNVARGGF